MTKKTAKKFDPLYGEVKAWPAGAWLDCHQVDLGKLFGGAA